MFKIFYDFHPSLLKFSIGIIIGTFLVSCSSINTNIKIQNTADSLLLSKYLKKIDASQNKVLLKADELLNKKFKTIIDKKIVPPSGDKHDYISRAIYYWPDSKLKKNKWKYIDGKINKRSLSETDHSTYYEMLMGLQKLSLAYNISGNGKYAKKSTELISDWFINEETKMNPNFNYAQAIPGKNDGTPSGIIDARGIIWVIDAIKLIRNSIFWTNDLDYRFKNWSKELLDWLLNSEFGEKESAASNNHGTFYDLQVIKLSTFIGKFEIAKAQINQSTKSRIEQQISLDGSLIEEMKRSSSHMYSIFNLSALIGIAEIAKGYEIDLWKYKNEDSGSIEDAVDFLVKQYKVDNKKVFKNKVNYKNLMRILPRANTFSDGKYNEIIDMINNKYPKIDPTHLYFVN